jgi:3-phosphoshikimate 1-carboxyvinyltransferase
MILYRKTDYRENAQVILPGSKSISHRMLIAAALCGISEDRLSGLSDSDDTRHLLNALQNTNVSNFHFEDGATPLHFFMAFAAAKNLNCTLSGSERLMQRPHGDLIDALKQCGAVIQENHGQITIEKGINGFSSIAVDASKSSQHISAMMLVAPLFPGQKEIVLINKPVSFPYLQLTADVMQTFGVNTFLSDEKIIIKEGYYCPPESLEIEPDWSAAAFFYSLVSCNPGMSILLRGLKLNSMQGDAALADFYKELGVSSAQTEDGVLITNSGNINTNPVFNLINHPDCAPAMMASCAFLRINASFTGLENLVLKESNRLEAMAANLQQTGAILGNKNGAYFLSYNNNRVTSAQLDIKTHGDHRIAMAMAVFGLKYRLNIDNPECVSKSFPGFWQQWSQWFNIDR